MFCRWERGKINIQILVKKLKGRNSGRPWDKWEQNTFLGKFGKAGWELGSFGSR
jgi:hypothetical protein